MKHAAHRAGKVKRTAKHASALHTTHAAETLQQAVEREVNAMPRTRREMRAYARSKTRKLRRNISGAVVLLFGTVGTTITAMNSHLLDSTVAVAAAAQENQGAHTVQATLTDTQIKVSRSSERSELTQETQSTQTMGAAWTVNTSSAATLDVNNLATRKGYGISASEVTHPTGDTGNAYAFSQCTWWVYTRRHQLGLPVGSHFGNGWQWANSARKLGYTVDRTPEVGAIIVFQRGQEGSDPEYGHVAIVEKINPDGSIVTSECGAVMQGKTYSRTLKNVSDFEYIHS